MNNTNETPANIDPHATIRRAVQTLGPFLVNVEATAEMDTIDRIEVLTEVRLLCEAVINVATTEAIVGARDEGETWQRIADALQVTRQAAYQQWSGRVSTFARPAQPYDEPLPF